MPIYTDAELDYQRLVKAPPALWPEEMRTAMARIVGERVARAH